VGYFGPVNVGMLVPVNLPVADTSPKINNLDEAEAAGGTYQSLELQIRKLQIRKNLLEQAAQRRGKQIGELRERQAKQEMRLRTWTEESKVMEGKAQLILRHVILNSKLGSACVAVLPNWTEKLSIDAMRMKVRAKKFEPFIRIKREIDRQFILKDSKSDNRVLSETALAAVGLEICQQKYFHVEPKLDQ
jgi:Bacteriophage Mu Gam like protein